MLPNPTGSDDIDDVDDLELALLLLEEEGLDETIYGLPSLLMRGGRDLAKPYPVNIYNLDGRKESGIAGTLLPDGTFRPLAARNIPRAGEHFDEQLKRKVEHTVVWDSVVVGCVEINTAPETPLRRLCDGSITGPWPIHPPKPDRLVSPEKAREAALEAERDAKEMM